MQVPYEKEFISIEMGKMNIKVKLIPILIITYILTSTQITPVNALYSGYHFNNPEYDGDVAQIVNNEFVDYGNQSSIDTKVINNDQNLTEIQLYLYGTPILDNNHGYRILICWNDKFEYEHLIFYWGEHVNFDLAIPSQSNFTVCTAGGIKGLSITNGSYTALYDSTGSLVFSETNNNSVSIKDNSLIFPVDQSQITTADYPFNMLVVTTFNTTSYDNTTSSFNNVTWMDSIPNEYIIHLFSLVSQDTNVDFIIYLGTIIMIGISRIIYVSKRK